MVPTSVTVDGIEYVDWEDITPQDFYKIIRNSKSTSKTSQATYARFLEALEVYAQQYEDIIYIGGSSKTSGSFQSANMAMNDIESNCNMYAIDSLSFSAGSAVLVIKACMLRDQGLSAKEIVDTIESLKGSEEVFVTVDDLEYMKRGGRISPAKAAIGSFLNIKPLITLVDGLPEVAAQLRGKKKAIAEIFNKATEKFDSLEDCIIVYGCGDNDEDLKALTEKIKQSGCKYAYEVKVGPTMTAHTGPAIIGMAILK